LKRKLIPLFLITIILVSIGCSTKKVYRSEFAFANKMATAGLWKEAFYRWNKILATGKTSAALYNNIAVALEEQGKLEEAEEAYQKALKLAPNNTTIQGNYNKLKKLLKGELDEKENEGENEKKNKKRK
jgi:Flp pilus assembly protein TadD